MVAAKLRSIAAFDLGIRRFEQVIAAIYASEIGMLQVLNGERLRWGGFALRYEALRLRCLVAAEVDGAARNDPRAAAFAGQNLPISEWMARRCLG